MKRRIGILTSGGDCPGLNACIRGVARASYSMFDAEIIGIQDGYAGLIAGDYKEMKQSDFSGILTLGGTILGTRRTPFRNMRVVSEDGVDKVKAMKANYKKMKLDCLVTLGGNGTHKTANLLAEEGLNVIGLPKTIDNDIWGTDVTFGFHTAVDIATEVIDRIHTTAASHGRCMVIEIMGNKAGWLTLYSGIAGGADIILLPEIPYDINVVADAVRSRAENGKDFSIIAVAEGAMSVEEAAMKKKHGIHVYDNSADFLKDQEVELVTIATRSPDHVKHAIEAAEAGKYVMVEKPIACTLADALELKKASEKFPGKIFIRHNRRFEPAFVHIREIIKSGKLGEIFEIKLCRHNFQWRADWQTLLDFGGGQLLNWGPHIVDHALQFLESPVREIWSDLKLVAAKGDAEDHLKIILKGENGRVVDLEISGGVSLPDPVYVVRGSRGSLVSYDEKRLKLKYLNPAVPIPEIKASSANPPLEGGFGGQVAPVWVEDELGVAPSTGDQTEKIWLYLYETIRNGAPYPITIDQAVEVVRVIDKVKQGPIDVVK